MHVPTIVLHDCLGHPVFIKPDHIGTRRAVDVKVGDNPVGKMVLEVDGCHHTVLETEAEIDRLIEAA
jgi:hypothetical protein